MKTNNSRIKINQFYEVHKNSLKSTEEEIPLRTPLLLPIVVVSKQNQSPKLRHCAEHEHEQQKQLNQSIVWNKQEPKEINGFYKLNSLLNQHTNKYLISISL